MEQTAAGVDFLSSDDRFRSPGLPYRTAIPVILYER